MSTQEHVSRLTSIRLENTESPATPFGVERPLTCEEAGELLRVTEGTKNTPITHATPWKKLKPRSTGGQLAQMSLTGMQGSQHENRTQRPLLHDRARTAGRHHDLNFLIGRNAGLAKALGVMMKLDFEQAVLNRVPEIEANPAKYFQLDFWPAPALYTVAQAAKFLNVSPRTINNLLRMKQLIRRKIGRRTLIPVTSLGAFLSKDHPTQ